MHSFGNYVRKLTNVSRLVCSDISGGRTEKVFQKFLNSSSILQFVCLALKSSLLACPLAIQYFSHPKHTNTFNLHAHCTASHIILKVSVQQRIKCTNKKTGTTKFSVHKSRFTSDSCSLAKYTKMCMVWQPYMRNMLWPFREGELCPPNLPPGTPLEVFRPADPMCPPPPNPGSHSGRPA